MGGEWDLLIVGGIVAGGLYFKDDIVKLLGLGSGGGGNGNGTPCTKTCTAPKVLDSDSCECITPGTGGGGGNGTPTGTKWYKANGPEKGMPQGRCTADDNRYENVVNGYMDIGFEVVLYLTVPKGKMKAGDKAGHIGLKHGGPNHKGDCGGCQKIGGQNCCWWDSGLRQTGKVYLEIEYPHPSNIKEEFFGNIGRTIDGPPLGVRWHISREGSGIRLMQWVDTSGKINGHNWKQTYNYLDDGKKMPKSYINKITKSQNIEIRVSDAKCADIKVHTAVAKKIVSGGTTTATSMDYFDDLVYPMVSRF